MPGGFQTQVNVQPAPALEGDFASANPRFSVLAGAGGLVAGASGVTIGRFAWAVNPSDPDESPTILNSFGSGLPTGFVHREQQALITAFLADASMVVPKGFPVTAMSGGDFWVKNNGTTQAFIGNKVYVNFKDGTAYFAATGATPTQASIVGTITAATAVFIGSVADEILTVASLSSGTVTIGSVLTGGTGLVTGVNIVSQLSGSIGGVGTYSLNEGEMTVNTAQLTGSYGLLNVTIVNSGVLEVGDTLTGTGGGGVTAGTFISALITGSGGTGTYAVNPSQSVTTAQFTANRAIETKWIAMSGGLAGELVKITDHPLG